MRVASSVVGFNFFLSYSLKCIRNEEVGNSVFDREVELYVVLSENPEGKIFLV